MRTARTTSDGRRWGAIIALAATLIPTTAQAYCRTSSCGDTNGTRCVPAQPADCGVELYWAAGCLSFSVQRDASSQVDFATAETLVDRAFSAWEQADCGGGTTPAVRIDNAGPVTCDAQEYNQTSGNANVIAFRDEVWPYAGQGNTLALTTVTFSLDTGEIFDADLEVNATPRLELTTTDDANEARYDLLSILTHEAGHMLGIAHTQVTEATMTVEYVPGDLELRSLHPDDEAALCAAYPPGEASTCDTSPRRGLQDDCGEQPEEEGCGCRVVGRTEDPGPGGFGLSLLLGLGLWRRRRRGS